MDTRSITAAAACVLLAAGTARAAPAAPRHGSPESPPSGGGGAALHLYESVAVSPDGTRIATIEADQPADPAVDPSWGIVVRPATAAAAVSRVTLPCAGAGCRPGSLSWAPDGKTLAFVLNQPKQSHQFVYAVGIDGGAPRRLLEFDGTLGGLRYGPGGVLAVLATAGAHKQPGATQAGAALAGEVGEREDEQRIATIGADGALSWQSPANLYVYEYDWRPDPAGSPPRFVGTAAPGNGDNEWWVAKLYGFSGGKGEVLYAPPPKQQLADPVVAPDGQSVAFVGGIMSDFGSTGGDVFRVSLQGPPGGTPALQDLTPNLKGSVSNLSWSCVAPGTAPQLTGTALMGANAAVLRIGGADPGRVLWQAPESISGPGRGLGISCGAGRAAAVKQSFTTAPELQTADASGPSLSWTPLTRSNAGHTVPVTARSITWRSDQYEVQGWLLSPAGAPTDPNGPKGPMITGVHGGPAAA
ncbi:MAG: PD40 domain-containing protein, partial [Gluconacetobacter diazotrophicus]|nr:PD40 domain-containing protein [Gluconacetobacter diazotrophicus]